jgi:hypothetical protein
MMSSIDAADGVIYNVPARWTAIVLGRKPASIRHCEERERRSNPSYVSLYGLFRFARNDGCMRELEQVL